MRRTRHREACLRPGCDYSEPTAKEHGARCVSAALQRVSGIFRVVCERADAAAPARGALHEDTIQRIICDYTLVNGNSHIFLREPSLGVVNRMTTARADPRPSITCPPPEAPAEPPCGWRLIMVITDLPIISSICCTLLVRRGRSAKRQPGAYSGCVWLQGAGVTATCSSHRRADELLPSHDEKGHR